MKQPINQKATKEAGELLRFLYKIKSKHILSGQHNYISSGAKYMEKVTELTGKTPLVWGGDFGYCYKGDNPEEYQHSGPINLTDPAEDAEFTGITPEKGRKMLIEETMRRHHQGHIITLMWHSCFPPDQEYCDYSGIWTWDNRPDMEVWRKLTTPGSELFKKWQKGVDRISSYLAILKEQKIPVLWRPYHEMNGTWFWWCDKKGKDGFARLWKQLYERMVDYHKLDNLIWVWNANAPRNIPGDEAYDYKAYFPGHDYVDILAADVYKNDYKRSHHDQLLELAQGKPISLAEVGELPNPEKLDSQQEWTWFMTWGNFIIDANDEEKVKQVYEHERVLSLNDVAKNDNGEWMLNQ